MPAKSVGPRTSRADNAPVLKPAPS